MQAQAVPAGAPPVLRNASGDGLNSGVSWAAILAGALAAAALSFILLTLGVGLGLSAVSPYRYSAVPMGSATIAWLAFMQLAASGIGGYLAGRLRVRWAAVHGDEVYFRDTAHGLLAWAVATLVTALVLAGGAGAVLGAASDGAAAAGGAALAQQAGQGSGPGRLQNSAGYFADTVLRAPTGDAASPAQREEVVRILLTDIAAGNLPADDRAYLTQLVAQRGGLSQPDAQRRVDDIYARASRYAADLRASADQARKTAAHSALWMFVALLLGAFVASVAATRGGRRRDSERATVRAIA